VKAELAEDELHVSRVREGKMNFKKNSMGMNDNSGSSTSSKDSSTVIEFPAMGYGEVKVSC
jgi:hypothetical protein